MTTPVSNIAAGSGPGATTASRSAAGFGDTGAGGRVLSPATLAAYAGDWALFVDWCTATGHTPLPADSTTLEAFTVGCPGAPATLRRRRRSIDHQHTAAGHPPPGGPREPAPAGRRRRPIDPEQAGLAMLVLPSHGWTGGLFGRRDKALLILATTTHIPYQRIATITSGHIEVAGGEARITDTAGHTTLIAAAVDPVVCGPCALARWQRIIDIDTRPDRRANLRLLLDKANPITSASTHTCHRPPQLHPGTAALALFPPITQWGHLPYPTRAMSRRAAEHLARQPETGLTHHRAIPTAHPAEAVTTPDTAATPAAPRRPVWDWHTANETKKTAVRSLQPLAAQLDDIEARIDALLARSNALEQG